MATDGTRSCWVVRYVSPANPDGRRLVCVQGEAQARDAVRAVLTTGWTVVSCERESVALDDEEVWG